MSKAFRFFVRSVFSGVMLGIIISPFYVHKSDKVFISAAIWGIVAAVGGLLILLVRYIAQNLRPRLRSGKPPGSETVNGKTTSYN
jgi:hypothetical protein